VVIRNLHPSTPTADISLAIEEIGFSTRQVTNIKHHQTKMALPMFFVDLEPDPSNKDIFNVKSILHTLVKVEEPHKRRDIPQFLNCQSYGHTRAYCSYPPPPGLNVVRATQIQYAKKRLTLPPPARCAPAVTQPTTTTKAALFTRSSKTAAVTHSPQPNSLRNLI
jgi:hypothetical protein